MTPEMHARVLLAYIQRLPLADTERIIEAYRACWREQASGNRGSQMQAADDLLEIATDAMALMNEWDRANAAAIVTRNGENRA